MTKTNFLLCCVILLVCIGTTLSECHHMGENRKHFDYEHALTDTVKITKDKLGRETAKIDAIQGDYRDFQAMHLLTVDSLGRELQKLVDRRTVSATIVTQEVHVAGDFKTTEVTRQDTSPNAVDCHPVYTLKLDETYRRGTIVAGADSFQVDLIYPEQLTFKNETSHWNLLKPTTISSTYSNSNPNVEITGMRTFAVRCDCSKKSWISFGIGGVAGSAIGFVFGRLK